MIEELDGLDELPHGWIRTQLDETAEIILGQSPPSSTYNEEGRGLPFYQGKLEFGKSYPTPRKWCTAPKKIAEKGDVLISVRAPVGPTNVCPERSCIGRGLAAIRGLGGIETFFIFYVLRAYEKEIARKGTGTTFSAISGDRLKELEIPLPPLNEQERIVAKLEELFTRLDAGVEGLQKVKAQLKRYRQAVLKCAFEGKLTEEWRKTHEHEMKPATLIERTKGKRQKALIEKQGESSFADSPELPETWIWTTVGELLVDARYGTSKKCHSEPTGIPVLRIPNIVNERLNFQDLKYAQLSAEEIGRLSLDSGDILVIRTNGSLDLVGRASSVGELESDYAFASYLIRLRPSVAEVLPRYLVLVLSFLGRKTIEERARTTAGQFNVNLGTLRSIAVPLPSTSEQNKIVEAVDSSFSFIEETQKAVNRTIGLAERLRQSILKSAFEGRLVPQDASDESAEKLLERIKKERAKFKNEKAPNQKETGPKQLELSDYVK